MRSFGKRVDGVGGRRRIKRRPVSIQATGASLGDSARGLIIEDICLTGARVMGRDLPREGTEILIRRGDQALLGEIVWAAADRRGILFNGARREAPDTPANVTKVPRVTGTSAFSGTLARVNYRKRMRGPRI